MRRIALSLGVFLTALSACSYVLPSTWRSFHADPDDAAPAITRALDGEELSIAKWDQARHKIETGWTMVEDGLAATRERFLVEWERDEHEGTLTIFVRHEAQDRDIGPNAEWGARYHNSDRESALMAAIEKELLADDQPVD